MNDHTLTPCDRCHGRGTLPDESYCPACFGLGFVEAAEMLRTLTVVRDADQLAKGSGQPGMGAGLRARIAETIALLPYSAQRYAEVNK